LPKDAVKIFTRRGHDWTSRLKKIATDAWRINARSAIIDGEVVAPSSWCGKASDIDRLSYLFADPIVWLCVAPISAAGAVARL
jgi:ATP-dependent DNA ligase